jgi:hypothetical protein
MRDMLRLTHEFVDYIPEDPKEGVIYISIPYTTAVHKCCCGCGNEVVTPLSPTDWKLIFDGQSISLTPSVGNWNFDCRSHYWIQRNTVEWARQWSRAEIDAGRAEDARMKEKYFHGSEETDSSNADTKIEEAGEVTKEGGLWQRLKRWLFPWR